MLRTRTQQRNLCTHCPIAKSAHIVGDSIVLIIIRELFKGSKRFGSIVEVLVGVSTRTITAKLRKMEKEGLVERKEYHEKPPRVEYSLTTKGKGLTGVIAALAVYGKKYL